MVGKASGGEWLDEAKACLAKAKTVEELGQEQAVVLSLEFGLPLEQVAQAIGAPVGRACQFGIRSVRGEGVPDYGARRRGGGRTWRARKR